MLFLDCEFEGHKGQLISMALVDSDCDSNTFYEVLDYAPIQNKWVEENVIPVLGSNKSLRHPEDFESMLYSYLRQNIGKPIIADSPADLIYLLDLMHHMRDDGKYSYEDIPLKLVYINSGRLKPKVPHNALSDAQALREWAMNTTKVMNLF